MRTLADLPILIQKTYGENHVAFKYKKGDMMKYATVKEYVQSSCSAASFLQTYNLAQQDRVMSILGNSPEWHYVEIGIFLCGAIHVPISPLMNSAQIEYVIESTEPTIILVNSFAKKKQMELILAKLNLTAYLFNIKEQNMFSSPAQTLNHTTIQEDDVAVILYTSGTTDHPKGVALTYKNIITSISEFSNLNIFNNCDDAISFLPLSHSGERKMNYSYLLRGISICFPGPIDSMSVSINFFKPHITAMVPYLLQGLLAEVKVDYNFNGLKVVCGGAPLHKHVSENFTRTGCKIFEVYGLTETSSLLSYNTIGAEMPGTVGRLAENIAITFSEQGEIWVKGDSVMKGYWINKNEINPSRNLQGWFQTGDLGYLNEQGFLTITGRNNNCFKNSKGVFINPELIEKQLSEFFRSEWVVIFPNETGHLSAVIKSENGLANEAERNIFIQYNINNPDNLKINRYLRIKDFMNGNPVTNSLKLNRNEIITGYKDHSFLNLF